MNKAVWRNFGKSKKLMIKVSCDNCDEQLEWFPPSGYEKLCYSEKAISYRKFLNTNKWVVFDESEYCMFCQNSVLESIDSELDI